MALLGLLGKAIGIDMKEVEEIFDDGMQAIRMSCYPPCPQPELVVGLTPHSDSTGITILNQVNGVEGLEIKKGGVWIPVIFHPDAFVVVVGDIMEVCHVPCLLFFFFFFNLIMKKKKEKRKKAHGLLNPVLSYQFGFLTQSKILLCQRW